MSTEKLNHDVGVESVHSGDDHTQVSDTLKAITSHPFSISEVANDFTSDQKYYILKQLNFESLVSLDELPISVTYMMEKINGLTVEESIRILEEFIDVHEDDMNVATSDLKFIKALLSHKPAEGIDGVMEKSEISPAKTPEWSESEPKDHEIFDWELQLKTEAGIIHFHSPYPEVRGVTDPYDDPTMYCETLRAYIVSIIWTAIGTFVNVFFQDRQPSIKLGSSVVQIFLYPSGMLMAYILPKKTLKIRKYSIDLNPGPWSHKEQMLATVFYTMSSAAPYVVWNITVLKMDRFYGVKWMTWGYQILMMLSTNFLGLGFAGIMRKFAVYPTQSIWPSLMPTLALNKALLQSEAKEKINGWKISRFNFFLIAFAGSFLWFWFPDYIFQALSIFSWISWIAPNNLNLATVTGSQTGLGFNPITTFDWNTIDFNGALTIPFYSQINQYIGTLIAFFCILGVWYSNYKWSAYLPINSNLLFTNTGETYAVSAILDDNNLFDQAKYEQLGPPFYTAANLVVYGAFFAIYPFGFLYMVLSEWKQIKYAFLGLFKSIRNFKRSSLEGHDDAFSRSMKKYKEVPEWCFLTVLIISLVFGIVCCAAYPSQTPVWGMFFALGINFVFLIPITLVYSITGFSFGLNVLVELIVGYALPGNGLALMFIKAIGYNIDGQAQTYISDQKLAHYTRVPPRAIFRAQMLSIIINSFVALAVVNFVIDSVDGYCEPHQKQKFTCPNSSTFYSASVLWGVIGPKKVFDGLYPILKWCFLMGFLFAIPCFAVKHYFRKHEAIKYFQPVLIIGGMLQFAPYNLSYITPGVIASYFFMHVIRGRYLNWFKKYTFLLSGSLTAGVAFSSIIIFFAVQYHPKDIDWWGNNVLSTGLDAMGPSLLDASTAPDGYFGPRAGHYP